MTSSYIIKLANLVGIEGNQDLGLKYLYECANSKTGSRVPAALLILLYWLLIYVPPFIPYKESRYSEATDLLKVGIGSYPDSPLFIWLNGYLAIRLGDLSKAGRLLEKASKIYSFPHKEILRRISFEMGWCNFLKFDWENSVKCLEKYLSAPDTEGESQKFALLLIGVSNCMKGNLTLAERVLQQLAKSQDAKKAERWVVRKAQKFFKRKWFQLFPLEIIYLTNHLGFMREEWLTQAVKFVESLGIPKPLIPLQNSFAGLMSKKRIGADEFCLSELLKGSIYRLLERLDPARESLGNVIKLGENGSVEEPLILPHALYELAMLETKQKNYERAEEYLNKAREYRKFDSRKELRSKIAVALQTISDEKRSTL